MTKKKAGGSGIVVDRSVDKASVDSRVTCSQLVETMAGDSPILKAEPALQDARDKLMAAGAELKDAAQEVTLAESNLEAARHVLGTKTTAWDHTYNVYVSNVEQNAKTPEDVSNLALHPLQKNVNQLAMPTGIDLKYDLVAAILRIHVHLPRGITVCEIEVSNEPTNPTVFKRMIGFGARREIDKPAPGWYWFRAASVRAQEQSEFCSPSSVFVK